MESGKTDIVTQGEAGNVTGAQFSPDGKYLAYARQDKLLRPHVWVRDLASGQEHMIGGDDFLQSSGPRWTPDGKRLLIIGGVGAPSMAALNRTVTQLYAVSLAPVDKTPDNGDVNTEEQAMAAANDPAAGRGGRAAGGAAAAPPVAVKIVWDGIDRRITQLTHMPGSVMFVLPAPDSRTYLFSAMGAATDDPAAGGPGMYTIGEDGTRMTKLNTAHRCGYRGRGGRGGGGGGSEPQWSRDGCSIYYLQGGGLYSLAIGGGVRRHRGRPAPPPPWRTRWTRRHSPQPRRYRRVGGRSPAAHQRLREVGK